MKFLPLCFVLLCVEALANECSPEPADRPCALVLENNLPSGKAYQLTVLEKWYDGNETSENDVSELWGANDAFPFSHIHSVSFIVDGSPLWLPSKAYTDLGNLTRAEVKENPHAMVLVVRGGAAADSYYATFVFINGKIQKRTVRSSQAPDQYWEKTIYHDSR